MAEIASAKLTIRPELLPSGADARVIDLGCGDGRHIAEAARRGCFSVGLDYDAGALREARQRLGRHRADLIVGDATRLPFRDAVFDAVICTETLEHLPDDVGAIGEIARVLRARGVLLGAVPSHFTELLFWKLSYGYWHTPGGHVRIYQPRELALHLRRAGLDIEGMRYVHFVDSLVWLRFCLTDFLRPSRPASPYEAAIMLAVAAERPVSAWRTRLRSAIGRSRFIATLDSVGALVWPKSFAFVARKESALADSRNYDSGVLTRTPRHPNERA
ncbi:MAG: class I SAM-dependent methyltransferase [Chloroflexota bacterium]|nr:class I SAM-dependent methyltransferase [Chloroflexota bacterium]